MGALLLLKIPGGEGGSRRRGGGRPRGREGVCREFGGGGGAKYFFSGPKFPPSCRTDHFLICHSFQNIIYSNIAILELTSLVS